MSAYPHRQTVGRAASGSVEMEKISAILRWWQSAFRRWQRRKMIAALDALDDNTLRNIGFHRSEIEQVVDGLDEHELRMVPFAQERDHDFTYEDVKKAA